MTSQPSNEERNRLRLQAWEQRNQQSSQAKGQNLKNVPLFGKPYKTNKGDELSNWIQRMLGSFDNNTTTEPFIVCTSSSFPLTNSLHPTPDPPYKSPKGSCANSSLRSEFDSHKCQNEDESQASIQDRHMIHSSLQKSAHHKQTVAADMWPHSPEPQCHGSTENTCISPLGNNMQFFTKGTSPPLNRTLSMSHSQAFKPPLSYKETNAAMMQKPTAYVRPMDGPEVVTESPERKPSPEHCTRRPDATLNKSIQEKASTLPQFLETLTSEIQCVEHILSEMTFSWPPLLSGIHSPRAAKTQSSVKVTEDNLPKQVNGEISSDPPLSLQSSSVDSESDSENGADDPPLNNSPRSETVPVLVPSVDWQLDKWINFSQQNNYRAKSQLAAPRSPNLSPLKEALKQSSVSVFSPDKDISNLPSLNQKTVNFPTPQLSSAQENRDHDTSHKSSLFPTDPGKPQLENQNGGVIVQFAQTSSQEQNPALTERQKVKRHHRQSRNDSVAFESEVTANHNKNKVKKAVKYDPCTACTSSNNSPQSAHSDHMTPACSGKLKLEAEQNLSQKDNYLSGCSQDSSKDSPSLVVKINLNLLSKIPRTLESPEIQHKPHPVTNSRKNDKGDLHRPKKKQKLQGNNASLHTARLENSDPSKKKSKKKCEMSLTLSAMRDCSQRYKKHAPQLNKEEVKCPNNPKKNSGKPMKESTTIKPVRESSSNRPLLRFENRRYPVKHYIKEAKRLKHKADAEVDKLRKIFHYLDAALFFVESGIAMDRDPQISMSSFTMFAETVELIKFVLKLTNWENPCPTENDLLALCFKCQALLQMAMFRHKEKTAISYSKTLIDHFNSSSQSPSDPPSFVKGKGFPMSPNNPLMGSGSAPCASAAGVRGAPSGSVRVPQDIGQVALTYVDITTLFLSAHDLWEQAEEFTHKGSGLLTELNKAMGVLSLTSTMSSMVCYIMQGLHWLQMDCLKVK